MVKAWSEVELMAIPPVVTVIEELPVSCTPGLELLLSTHIPHTGMPEPPTLAVEDTATLELWVVLMNHPMMGALASTANSASKLQWGDQSWDLQFDLRR